MEAITQIETFYLLRMTRYEAAKMLVTPEEAQAAVRGLLSPDETGGAVESPAALPKPERKALPAPGPATRKALRKLRAVTKRVACPECGERFPARGINIHIARKHRRNGHASAPDAPSETETQEEA